MNSQDTYQGIIFDFNRVLLRDDAIRRESWRSFSTQLRNRPLPYDEVDLHVHRSNNEQTIEYLLGKPIRKAKAED